MSSIPDWSDSTGEIKQTEKEFDDLLPKNWTWKGSWESKPQFDIAYELEREEIYEYQTREMFSDWETSDISWHDMVGEPVS